MMMISSMHRLLHQTNNGYCEKRNCVKSNETRSNNKRKRNYQNNNNNNNQEQISIELVVEILELADRFFVDHLKQVCEKVLQQLVCNETVEYLLEVSNKTNALQLQSICKHFLRNHHQNNNTANVQGD
mmetsp:Transcript_2556/g.6932  ORF Transcript_2556/g.6932 Transcript_2556/m.6932 type:complete len:128 (+) Transcript_2556:1597-1980(+)